MVVDLTREHETLKAREAEFKGKHVLVVGDEIYELGDDEEAKRLLDEVRRAHPGKIPLITYVMEEEIYILCL